MLFAFLYILLGGVGVVGVDVVKFGSKLTLMMREDSGGVFRG